MSPLAGVLEALRGSRAFAGAPEAALERLAARGEIAHAPAGAVIIEEGEYDAVCYVILRGRFSVAVTNPDTGQKRTLAELGAGEMVGEMAVLSGTPRLAEVRCLREASLLRIDRDTLVAFLDEAPAVKAAIDQRFRERALSQALSRVDVFAPIARDAIERLARAVTLETRQKDETIFAAGSPADAFYFIRDGFVKLARVIERKESEFFDPRFDKISFTGARRHAEEYIMAYLGRGAYFGERALFDERPRNATATAITRVELVRISRSDFHSLLGEYPEVEGNMRAIAASRYAEAPPRGPEGDVRQEMLRWVGAQGLLGGDATLVLDLDLCVRCLNCLTVCAALHGGISRITHNGVRYRNILVPTSCRHCREPTCMIGCPTGAIQRAASGEVFHLDTCIGCGNCARRCPFGNISIVRVDGAAGGATWRARLREMFFDGPPRDDAKARRKAVKCDFCLGYDHYGCAHNCPTGAIQAVKPSEFFARMR